MKCTHCGSSKSIVTETRRLSDGIYRRRRCAYCDRLYITVETTSPGLRIPDEAYPQRHAKRERERAAQVAPITGDAADLSRAWHGASP